MADLTKMMPLLVSMRAMCDALLLEIADSQKKTQEKRKGFLKDAGPHVHELKPGFGSTGICDICGETVAREVKDG